MLWSDLYTTNVSFWPLVGTAVTFGGPGTGALAYAVTTNGVITSVNVILGGTGYTSAPSVTFVGVGSGAAATATVSGGAVVSVAVTAGGTGYTVTAPSLKLNIAANPWDTMITSLANWRDNVNGNQKNLSNLGSLAVNAPFQINPLQVLCNMGGGVMPSGGLGYSMTANWTAGSGETDFWNLDTTSTGAFDFYQKTGVSTAALLMRILANGNVGISVAAPNVPLDVNGAIASRKLILTLANGANENINIGANTYCVISGPTSAFQIGGFTGGSNGRLLIIVNGTGQTMTINNLDGSSSSANQIFTIGKGNVSPSITSLYIYDGTTWNLLFNF